ncbi:MAG: HD domain-containing protein [Clostridia bacterium]|nr:HD domain-containing protein [Clostridia bacterium]
MDFKSYLDKVLLSDDVVKVFHNEYENNPNFKKHLVSVLPEIDDCAKREQNNPWHIYNVLDHILHSVEAMNKQSKGLPEKDRIMLAYTMFLHDIGKPECHLTRMKKGVEIDSFFNHNKAGEKIANRFLPQIGFNEKDTKVIAKLVDKHDIFMFIQTGEVKNPHHRKLNDKLINGEIKELSEVGDGESLLRYLVMVGRSDNLAQNPEMTADSLKMLDKFDEMLDNRLQMANQ